jgi:hypothetical protein
MFLGWWPPFIRFIIFLRGSFSSMPTTLDVGNFFLFLSGFLMIYTAYRDREVLKGYNLVGTLVLVLGIGLVIVFYVQEGYWVSVFLTLPNYGYWLVVAAALIRKRIR